MKIDLEKFLAATMLLATATAPACGGQDAKKTETKADVKAAQPAPPAAPAPTAPAPTAAPPAAPETPPATPPAGDAADKGGGAAAKPDPGPEEEKPSW